VIDLRITGAGWSRVKDRFGADPSPGNWIELRLDSAADLDRFGGLLAYVRSSVTSRPGPLGSPADVVGCRSSAHSLASGAFVGARRFSRRRPHLAPVAGTRESWAHDAEG
jgi:hypothetical protein